MCFIAKAVFILAIYNASKSCFGPFVSVIGNVILIGSNIRYQNLPTEDCWPGMQHVLTVSQPTSRELFARAQPFYTVSEPTSRGLFASAAACFPTYLKVTPGDCWPRMQPVNTVSNSTYGGMSVQGAACLYRFITYLARTVGWGCSQFMWFLNQFRDVSYSKSCLDFCHL